MKKLIILLTLNVLFAQVPHKMSFQAYLTDANNMPVLPGSYEMTFRIYDALTEGSKVWEESQTVTVDGSLVSVMLGNTVPLVALSSAGYLEIQLMDEVLSPRQELGGTMFAIRAVNADKATIADTATIAVGYAKLDTLRAYAKTGDIANTLDGLTDALVESNSIYVGNDPSSTTDEAEYNVALGMIALDAITTGDYNTATGYNALYSNTTGAGNTAFGANALQFKTTGWGNTAVGFEALRKSIFSEIFDVGEDVNGFNTAVGFRAGHMYTNSNTPWITDEILHGDKNVFIGSSTRASSPAATNQIVIGHGASGPGDNSAVIGNSDITSVYAAEDGQATIYAGGLVLGGNTIPTEKLIRLSHGLSLNDLRDAFINSFSIYVNDNPPILPHEGKYNVALGMYALDDGFLSGDSITAVGHDVLTRNTTGYNNTATGYKSLSSNTTGYANTASGSNALAFNTTGSYNTAVGLEALYQANRTADVNAYNTAIGYKAGGTGTNDITTGDKNVLIGSSTAASKAAATNQIVIGHGASGTGDNSAVIGNSDITSVYAAEDGSALLYAYGIAQPSDRRVKKSINSLAYGLNFIMKLRPVSYYKLHPRNYPQELKDKFYPDGKIRQVGAEDYDKLQVGFIAQEVKAVNDEMHAENNIVSIDEDGFHRMDYEKIIVPLVKAVQEQQAQISELQNKINAIMEMQASSLASKSYGEGDQ